MHFKTPDDLQVGMAITIVDAKKPPTPEPDHHAAMLIPVLVATCQHATPHPYAGEVLLVLATQFPYIVVRVISTSQLPQGPLDVRKYNFIQLEENYVRALVEDYARWQGHIIYPEAAYPELGSS